MSYAGGPYVLVLALCASYGVHLIYSAVAFGWRGMRPGKTGGAGSTTKGFVQLWSARMGLEQAPMRQLGLASLGAASLGALGIFVVFGGPLAPMLAAPVAGYVPFGTWRARRRRGKQAALEAWPRMLDELRLLAGSLGWSIPQALFEVGRNGPRELRPSFAQAEREWLVSTDFAKTIDTLKALLADASADAALETLLIAQEVGGGGLNARLQALVTERNRDLQTRRDAQAKQAGVRFARRFVLVVPLAMAGAGMSIGTGRSGYATTAGQWAIAVAAMALMACWWWATRLLRLPEPQRVFPGLASNKEGSR